MALPWSVAHPGLYLSVLIWVCCAEEAAPYGICILRYVSHTETHDPNRAHRSRTRHAHKYTCNARLTRHRPPQAAGEKW